MKKIFILLLCAIFLHSNAQVPNNIIAIDLGLPSGTKWANMNVGAMTPEGYGNYYAWGETETKDYYYYNTYKWCNGDIYSGINKYCTNSSFGTIDNISQLESTDDAVIQNWGNGWRMPTVDELQELYDYCKWEWTEFNGIPGYKISGNNNHIFLPATGWIVGNEERGIGDSLWGTRGCYWTSSLSTSKNYDGMFLSFHANSIEIAGSVRHCGHTIRAVINSDEEHLNDSKEHTYVDLGLLSGTLWATHNIGAENPEDYGCYYAWGETETKSTYTNSNYKFGDLTTITKYCTNSKVGIVDNIETLEAIDDAANVIWGNCWRMPTYEEQLELISQCSWSSKTVNGKAVYKIVGPNGKYILLPKAGFLNTSGNNCIGTKAYYWSSTLYTGSTRECTSAYHIWDCGWYNNYRKDGMPIRPIFQGESKDGIGDVSVTDSKVINRYSVKGERLLVPHKGINILKMSNGTVKKVFVK